MWIWRLPDTHWSLSERVREWKSEWVWEWEWEREKEQENERKGRKRREKKRREERGKGSERTPKWTFSRTQTITRWDNYITSYHRRSFSPCLKRMAKERTNLAFSSLSNATSVILLSEFMIKSAWLKLSLYGNKQNLIGERSQKHDHWSNKINE